MDRESPPEQGRHGGRGRGDHGLGGHGHRGRGEGHHEGGREARHAAQTFRRGRALAFLEGLRVKRDVLRKQLNDPDLQAVKEVVSGELKAVEEILQQFVHAFEIHESEMEERGGSR